MIWSSLTAFSASKYIVYGLTDPRTGEVRYIGKSARGLHRPRDHRRAARLKHERTHKSNWIRSLLALGMSYGIVILEEVDRPEDLASRERFWISHARAIGWRLTNMTDGGEGALNPPQEVRAARGAALRGRKHTLASRQLMSIAQRGRKLSDEARQRISLVQQGKKQRPESVLKRAAAIRGRKQSPEHVAKRAAAFRGRVLGPQSQEHIEKRAASMRETWKRKNLRRALLIIVNSPVEKC
ncbi:NUMOD3 domain-containing DNA-binding protein [Corallococcus exiguus]|uniref:NUMOD3 domain-containing DNA-binding protein n=1 Tax=Corallococcus exiguus TaxID=83462 RepID=UPI0014945AA1|nr:NUMOD3 domain-containing DNA-binding protein [Corallococcus exiguus]NPD22036.1 hypothetical protein [Corallococcus exiguus]